MERAQDFNKDGMNRRWRPALIAFFARRVGNHAEAEDMTHEVFVRLFASTGSVNNTEGFIFEIARNLIIDRARKLRVREQYRETVLGDRAREIDFLDPHTITAGKETMGLFVSALQALPERTRTIYVLYRLEDMSQEKIGQALGISASAVKQQVAKATAFLMKKMRDAE